MWDQGDDKDSGIAATNRGVLASFQILGWTLLHLRTDDPDADVLGESQLIDRLTPYARSVGEFYSTLSQHEIAGFRKLYGGNAPREIAFSIGRFIREGDSRFNPEGLAEWIESRDKVDVDSIQSLCTSIERRLLEHVTKSLKGEYGDEEWWFKVPVETRKEAAARREEETQPSPIEHYLKLIDIRKIALANWALFQDSLGMGDGNKEKRTQWTADLNEVRRRASHAAGLRLTINDLDRLKEIDTELRARSI